MGWLVGLARLRGLVARVPWYAVVIAVLVLIAGIERLQVVHLQGKVVQLKARVTARDKIISDVRAAQAKADAAARQAQKRAAAANAINNERVSHDHADDVAKRDRALAAIRLQIAALGRAAGGGAVPGASRAAGGADDAAGDARLSLADEATLRGQCQADVDQLNRLIDWTEGRAEASAPPG